MIELVEIPTGTFLMGSSDYEKGIFPDERPQHEVTVPKFLMGKYLVTQHEYESVVGNNPSYFKKSKNLPVDSVSWNMAVEFCQMLTEQSGEKYRLPTEAEWEYACRAGTNTLYSFGDLLSKTQANYGSYSTVEVGSFPPNNFGLYDMPGNVWEWSQDHWHDNYLEAPTDGRAWLDNDENDSRILRGGSWYCDRRCCRSAFRTGSEPDDQDNEYGFRVVCEIAK